MREIVSGFKICILNSLLIWSALLLCIPEVCSGVDIPDILRKVSAHYRALDKYAVRISVVTTHDFNSLHGQSRGGPVEAATESPIQIVLAKDGRRLRYELHDGRNPRRDVLWIDDSSTVFRYSPGKNEYSEQPSSKSDADAARHAGIWDAEWRYISKFQLLSTLPVRFVKKPKRQEMCEPDSLVLEADLEKTSNSSSSERLSVSADGLFVCRSSVTTRRVGTDGVFEDVIVATWTFQDENSLEPELFKIAIPPGAKRGTN